MTNKDEPTKAHEPAEPPTVPPIQNRFLFVDVAAQRAKQLRRGALPRLPVGHREGDHPEQVHKAERIAMDEVRHGLVPYDLPKVATV